MKQIAPPKKPIRNVLIGLPQKFGRVDCDKGASTLVMLLEMLRVRANANDTAIAMDAARYYFANSSGCLNSLNSLSRGRLFKMKSAGTLASSFGSNL
jgi:hypothetical protein